MALVDAKCPNCGGGLRIDNEKKAAVCPFCKEAYIVQDAINNYITNNNTYVDNLHADVVNVYGSKSRTFTKDQLLDRIKTFTLLGNVNEVTRLFSELISNYPDEATKEKLLDHIKRYASVGDSSVVRGLYSEYIKLYPEDYVGYWEMYKIDYEENLKKVKTRGGIRLNTLFVTDYVKNAIILNPSLEKEYYSMVSYAISNHTIIDNPTTGYSDLPGIQTLKPSHPIRVSYEQGMSYVQKLNALREQWIPIMGKGDYIREQLSKRICSILGLWSRSNDTPARLLQGLQRFSVLIGNTLMCGFEYGSEDCYRGSILLSSPPSDIIDKIEQTLKSCYWFMDGRCPYCGGRTTFFNDTCKQCGKKRRLEW